LNAHRIRKVRGKQSRVASIARYARAACRRRACRPGRRRRSAGCRCFVRTRPWLGRTSDAWQRRSRA
jgi:hypothetical protein